MCVTEAPCPFFHPEKQKYSLFISPPVLLFLLHPLISLCLHLALIRPCSQAGEMTDRGKGEWRGKAGGEKDMTAPQQVWSIREGEGGRGE